MANSKNKVGTQDLSSIKRDGSYIIAKGVRVHNLKNIDIAIPKNQFVVISGVSGSGKSSLAFDTIYAEGQRRYIESVSSYARQFLEVMDKPDVDSIDFLSPAVSIEQKSVSRNPRSNVGTITEILDYMRLLFARVGDVYCPNCGKKNESYTVQQIVDIILAHEQGTKLEILSPIVRGRKGEQRKLFETLNKEGFIRVYIDGELFRLSDDEINIDKNSKHDISVVVDRIVVKDDIRRRVTDSVEVALKRSGGLIQVKIGEQNYLYSENYSCVDCDISIEEIEPRTFSFNSPYGACPDCKGLGEYEEFDVDLIAPDPTKSIREGAIRVWEKQDNYHFYSLMNAISTQFNVDLNTPWGKLSKASKDVMLYGIGGKKVTITIPTDNGTIDVERQFEGAVGTLNEMLSSNSYNTIQNAKSYMRHHVCNTCGGSGLRKEALSVRVDKYNIFELTLMSIEELSSVMGAMKIDGAKGIVASKIIQEIMGRLTFLNDVGLGYISLARKADTLSGGESQRIRLATQIGSGLTGIVYVLDEPSIGLHQRDNDKLIATLQNLKNIGNSVLVVEHDEDMLMQADYVIDIGPGAGRLGGEVIFAGTPDELLKSETSLTGQYMSGKLRIATPIKRRQINKDKMLSLKNINEHNIKDVSVDIPLGLFVCVTGVSGSGKSTLIMDVLYSRVSEQLYRTSLQHANPEGKGFRIEGLEHIDKVINIDQTPIGRTPRSNPATYTGVFTDIRDIFAETTESKRRGYKTGRFSFNAKGGRCEKCSGDGYVKIEMHFMPDLYVKCDECHGLKYNRDTLEIKFNGKNIAEVLDMTVNQAVDFFENISKIQQKLLVLQEIGMGYIKLGQPATTLSGGEAQRIKLAKELMKRDTGDTLYIFDEPTTGLHFDDINKLIVVFQRLVDAGNSLIIIEHNLDVIKCADYIIDMGPDGGVHGGQVVFTGTPEELMKSDKSYLRSYLKTKI